VTHSYSFITALNLGFAVLCVCLFSEDAKGIQNPVVDNLSKGTAAQGVRVLLCLDLLFTIPMVLAVGREVVEGAVLAKYGPQKSSETTRKRARSGEEEENAVWVDWLRSGTRFGLVLLVFGLACGAAKSSGVNAAFGHVLNLIGGLTNTTVGLILPPIVFYRAAGSRSAVMLTVWGSISFAGAVLLVSSTYYTAKSMAGS